MFQRVQYCLLSTPGLFPALRKASEHSTASRALNFFLRAGNNPVVLKNSTEHAETEILFITLMAQQREPHFKTA